MKGKRILVTGASGFIGSHLVHRLLREGSEVAALVRYGNIIKNERLKDCWQQLRLIEGDLRNRGALDAVKPFKPHIVFHLGAYNHVGESFRQVEECFDVNAKGTANLADVCEDVHRFVYVSTSEVYGHQPKTPFSEDLCPQPVSPYSITKYAGELYCRMKREMGQHSMAIVRLFNAFGPYQSTKAVIPELIIKCLKGEAIRTTPGAQTREFNFVDNLIDGLMVVATAKRTSEEVVNFCSHDDIAIRDLVHKIAELTQTKSKLEIGALPERPNEIRRLVGDNHRAKKIFGWTPKVDFEEGLKRTIAWYRSYLQHTGDFPAW